jgi:hypothetical protein
MEAQNVLNSSKNGNGQSSFLATFLNAAIFALRGRREIEMHPELREGHRSITRGFVTWGNLPWVVMGVGRFHLYGFCVYWALNFVRRRTYKLL